MKAFDKNFKTSIIDFSIVFFVSNRTDMYFDTLQITALFKKYISKEQHIDFFPRNFSLLYLINLFYKNLSILLTQEIF